MSRAFPREDGVYNTDLIIVELLVIMKVQVI